jgi:hypothetical protein
MAGVSGGHLLVRNRRANCARKSLILLQLLEKPGFGVGPEAVRAAQRQAEQVSRIRTILENLSLEIATPKEARAMLNLKGGDQVAF